MRKKPVHRVTLTDGTVALTTDFTLLAVPRGVARELEITAKTRKGEETSYSVALADPKEWDTRILSFEQQLRDAEQTPGQFFAAQLSKDPHYRVRQRLVYRARYQAEFDALWDEQAKHYPELSDPKLYQRVLDRVLPRNSTQRAHWAGKSLKEFVRDYILFFQRPLKTKRSTVGECPIESVTVDYVDRDTGEVSKRQIGRKVIPASHPLYQEYRSWAAVNNIRLRREGEAEGRPLTDEQKARLFGLLQTKDLLAKDLPKVLPEIDTTEFLISSQDKLPGHATRIVLAKAAQDAGTTLGALGLDDPQTLERVWHLLYSHNDDIEAVHKSLTGPLGMTAGEAEVFGRITFARSRGAYSAKALNKLMPLMRAGDYHDARQVSQHAHLRLRAYAAGALPTPLHDVLAKAGVLRSDDSSVARGLPVYAALALQYGHHEGQTDKVTAFESADEIQAVRRHSLRNPIVERIVNEALFVVRDIWRAYGRPDAIRVELARELQSSQEERKRRHDNMRSREKENERIREELRKADYKLGHPPTRKDLLRYQLWEEQKCRCPYTGRKIQAADLFSGNTDIDHILAQQRYQDDSYGNKVLTFRKVNEEKGNKTPLEFIRAGSQQIADLFSEDAFRQNVRDLYPNPRSRKRSLLIAEEIPDDFGERALQNTRYMNKRVVELLEPVCPDRVHTTAGPVTAYLRRRWGLDEVFKTLLRPRFERLSRIHGESWAEERVGENGRPYLWLRNYSKRIDHRHHALDAIVTAATSQGIIQRLSNLSQAYDDDLGRVPEDLGRHIKPPARDFDQQVLAALRSVVVSHKATNRLLTRSLNRYQVRDSATGKIVKLLQDPTQTQAVRGSLHQEQAFGEVRKYKKIKVKEAFAETAVIAVPWQRELIEARLAEFGGDVKAAVTSLRKRALRGQDDELLDFVTTYDTAFAKNRSLASLSTQQLTEIADQGTIGESFRRQLQRLEKGESHDIAVERLNTELKQAARDEAEVDGGDASPAPAPVYTTRTHSFGDKTRLVRQGGPTNHWIDTGDSYALAVRIEEDGSREFENVKFYDAIQRVLTGEDPVGERDFAISKGQTYFVPSQWGSQDIDGQRGDLYVNRRISEQSPSTRFAPVNLASGLPKEFIYDSYTDSAPNTTEPEPRVVREVCFPVELDRLGRIRISDDAS